MSKIEVNDTKFYEYLSIHFGMQYTNQTNKILLNNTFKTKHFEKRERQ